jgi:3-hydroxyisobutyrate dehydrogenase
MKVINQLLVGCHMAVAAEAMALGLREGVDPNVLYDMVTHGAGNSWIFQDRATRVLAGDYAPKTALDIPFKDIGLVLETAKATGFPLVMAPAAYQMFARAHVSGYGKQDDAALIKIFPGIDLPRSRESGGGDDADGLEPSMYP